MSENTQPESTDPLFERNPDELVKDIHVHIHPETGDDTHKVSAKFLMGLAASLCAAAIIALVAIGIGDRGGGDMPTCEAPEASAPLDTTPPPGLRKAKKNGNLPYVYDI